jgi:predicted N-formylglutamate amidohydrolase
MNHTINNITNSTLLQPNEPPAFDIINSSGLSSAVLVCDHASNRVPECLHHLGLTDQQLQAHISWDPGAAAVARLLSQMLDAPLVVSGYSRLVIDCNRPLSSPELIAAQSAGIAVPGNKNLSPQEHMQRIDTFFHPYHRAIEQLLDTRPSHTGFLLSIHSFTPELNGAQRPWHIGVSFKRDEQFAGLMYEALRQNDGIHVGFNQPYPIEDAFDYSIPEHGDKRGLHSAMIELRQDGVETSAQITLWAECLAAAYRSAEAKLLNSNR